MSNVIALRPRRPSEQLASSFFERAWLAFPQLGRLRSSRKEAQREWLRACREVGEEALLNAVIRYVAEDKEHKRECGPPGFHRWLKWGRYEHWIGEPVRLLGGKRFPDEAVRAEIVAALGEGFVVSYLDPCEVEGTVLVVRTGIAMTKLGEKGVIFKALGFTGMRKSKIGTSTKKDCVLNGAPLGGRHEQM